MSCSLDGLYLDFCSYFMLVCVSMQGLLRSIGFELSFPRIQFSKTCILNGTNVSIFLLASFSKRDIPLALLILTTTDPFHLECWLPVAYFHFSCYGGRAVPAAMPSHLRALQFQQAKQQECDSLCIQLNVHVHKILSTLISFCILKLHRNCLPTHKIADCAYRCDWLLSADMFWWRSSCLSSLSSSMRRKLQKAAGQKWSESFCACLWVS